MGRRTEPTAAEAEASQWLARLSAPDASSDDRARFDAWLNADPDNRQAFEAMQSTWRRLSTLSRHAAHRPPPQARRTPRLSRPLLAAAAAIVVAILGIASLQEAREPPATIVAETGALVHRTLPDGSAVELNARSRISYHFSQTQRHVRLEEGDAYFRVAHDPTRPFVVATRFGALRVVGTTFVVHLDEARARTTVLEGAVEGLPQAEASFSLPWSSEGAGGRKGLNVIGRANDEIILSRTRATVASIPQAQVERRLAWREGMLFFDGDTLAQAVREVERHTGVAFAFSDPALAKLKVGGYIKADDLEGFEALLRANFSIEMQERSDGSALLTATAARAEER